MGFDLCFLYFRTTDDMVKLIAHIFLFFLQGTKDDLVDVNCARYIASKVPQAETEIVEGMGHATVPRGKLVEYLIKLRDLALGVPAQESM